MSEQAKPQGSGCQSDAEIVYTAHCSGCRRDFTNYSGGGTYCLHCTRGELEKAREQGIRDEVNSLVEIASEIVMKASNQAALLLDGDKERKLDAIHGLLNHV